MIGVHNDMRTGEGHCSQESISGVFPFNLACFLNYVASFSFYLACFVLICSIKCNNKTVRCKLWIGRDGEYAKGKMGFLAKPAASGGKSVVPCGTSTEQRFL